MSTLSVETSSSGSSTSTWSPTCLSQRVTVPSVTLSPRAGMVTGVPPPPCRPPESPDWLRGGLPAAAARSAAAASAGCSAGCWSLLLLRCWSAARPAAGPAALLAAARACCSLWPACRCSCWLRPAGRLRSPPPRRTVTDHGQLGADRDRLVLADDDALEHPGGGGGDLGVDLVGRDLEQRLVDLDLRHPPASATG